MSTGKTNLTSTQFAAKKLLGKAHTSNKLSDVNESIPSNVSMPSDGIYAEPIPNSPGDAFYTLYSASADDPATVERVYFDIVGIDGTEYDANDSDGGGDEASDYGKHGYYLKLPSNYESTSSNPNASTGSFTNGKRIYDSRGALQLVHPLISNASPNKYFLKLYKGDPSNPANEITSGDSIDWQIDYYSGVVFIQDFNSSIVPVTASAYLYVGKYLNEKLSDIDTEAGNITVKDEGSIVTTSASSLNFVGSGVVATNSGGDVTVTIDDAAITALNNQAENRLVTIGSTTTELDGEANLTFDGSELILTGSSIFNGSLTSSNIVPLSDEQYDLGQVELRYENLYAKFLDGGLMFTAINDEGATITRGQAVYVKGISGQTPTIALAAADDASKMPVMGLVADGTSNDGNEVRIVTLGRLNGFDTSMFSAGDTLYVQTGSGGVSGSLTNSPPTGSGALIQNIARVLKSDNSGQVRVGGAGRTNATPNLDKGHIFIGNDSDQAVQDNTVFISSSVNKVGINTINPTHTLTVNGTVSASAYVGIETGISYSRTQVTTTITASVSSTILGVTASSAVEIRLPSAGDYDAGQYFTVKDESGLANSNSITILASGSQTIDGQASIVLESPYAAVNLYSNGTDKFFIY